MKQGAAERAEAKPQPDLTAKRTNIPADPEEDGVTMSQWRAKNLLHNILQLDDTRVAAALSNQALFLELEHREALQELRVAMRIFSQVNDTRACCFCRAYSY